MDAMTLQGPKNPCPSALGGVKGDIMRKCPPIPSSRPWLSTNLSLSWEVRGSERVTQATQEHLVLDTKFIWKGQSLRDSWRRKKVQSLGRRQVEQEWEVPESRGG